MFLGAKKESVLISENSSNSLRLVHGVIMAATYASMKIDSMDASLAAIIPVEQFFGGAPSWMMIISENHPRQGI